MAEAGNPQPDGPRPPAPRTRGVDRGRDPVALAAWRRVAEQRRRATDPAAVEKDVPDVEAAPRSGDAVVADGVAAEPQVAAEPVTADPAVSEPAAIDAGAVDAVAAGAVEPVAAEPVSPTTAVEAGPLERRPVVRSGSVEHGGPGEQRRPEPHAAPPEPAPARAGQGDGPPPEGRLHDVLLGLAGRLDDDALTSVREMVAAEDDAEAAELLGGCLLAGGVGLTPDERTVLRPWFTAARVDPEVLGLLPADAGALNRSVHRFAPTAGNRMPGLPLARAARRLPGVVAVRESWRVTPAGSAPGPVPHRVVLVETAGPDDCDHVVHHLAHAARSLDDTSVEVFPSGAALPAYHREALAAARPLVAEEAATTAPAPPAERPAPPRFGAVDDEETWQTVADSADTRTTAPVVGSRPPGDGARTTTPVPTPPPYADDEEPGLEDVGDPAEDAVAAGTASVPAVTEEAVEPTAPPAVETPQAAPETSIDDDLSSTARRIAALWARPAPEDFSAPLPAESLEPTRLEPDGEGPAPDDESPSGRHGLPAPAPDLGTTSFRSPTPRSRTNGHRVDPAERDGEVADTASLDSAEPAAEGRTADDDGSGEDARVLRSRHSRARDEDTLDPDAGAPRFGHDARFGAGSGPAWPGGPVTGDSRPGPDTLFPSPVEVGDDPVTFGTNGHRHGPGPASDDDPATLGTNGHRHEPVTAGPHDEPATGPVAWAGPAAPPPAGPQAPGPQAPGPQAGGPPGGGPHPGGPYHGGPQAPGHPPAGGPPGAVPPMTGPPAPGHPGNGVGPHPGPDVAPPWAAQDGASWPSEAPGWTPAADGGHDRVPAAESTAAWTPDLDDSVAQLSDRERELLARLHEELAQRERAEGADPFAGPPPSDRQAPPQQPGQSGPRRPRPGPPQGPPPGGRVNGHGLPGSPDDAGA